MRHRRAPRAPARAVAQWRMPVLLPRAARRFRAEAMFRPGAVAVIGGGRQADAVLANLAAFPGTVMRAAPDAIGTLPHDPDLAVIADAGPDGAVAPVLAALAARNCAGAIVPGAAPDLAEAARAAGLRVLGPGAFGLAVPAIGLCAAAFPPPRAGRLALVAQSAALCRAVLDWAEPNGVGFSHVVGLGGAADLGFAEVLDWLARDPGTGAILLDIRRVTDRMAFLSAARAASRLRPVVALHAGGRLRDPSGTGEAVFRGAMLRAGILGVASFAELTAAAETLTHAPPPRGEALAIVTNAVGPGMLGADAALREGLPIAALPEAAVTALRLLVPGAGAACPVAVPPDQPTRLAEVASMLAGIPSVGGVLAVHAPVDDGDGLAIAALAAAARAARQPLLVCAMGEHTGAANRRALADAGVPAFATPEQAVRGFLHLVRRQRAQAAARELPPASVLALAPDRAAARAVIATARAAGHDTLAQDEALAVLAAYGVAVAPTRVAADAGAAAEAAATLGFPAVVKRRRRVRPADDAPGGLALDLRDADAVRAAARAILGEGAPAGEAAPTIDGGELLVQRQVPAGRELALCIVADADFGPAIGFGLGGTAAAVLGDLEYGLPPLNLMLAHALMERTRAGALLAPFRDRPGADADAVAATLVRISQLLIDLPEIAALDLDPLVAGPHGACAVDAWIALHRPGERTALAIAPYPAERTVTLTLGGEVLTFRPIRPEDAAAHQAFFARLSPEDVRLRFFSAIRALSAEQVARMTQVDYVREIAFVAVREPSGETVGVARLVREPPGDTAEFAVVVQPDMAGRGVARRLMLCLIDWARAAGVGTVTGQVLAENARMLAFVRRLGFAVRRSPEDADVMEVRLDLAPAAAGDSAPGK